MKKWRKTQIRKETERGGRRTRHQEASNGQRYPCPALYSFWVKVGLQRGSSPDRGQSPVEWGDFQSVCSSIHLSIRPSVYPSVPPLRAQEQARQALDPSSQASEPAKQASEPLRPGWLALRPACLALKPAWLALRPAWLAFGPLRGGQTDKWTDKQTDKRIDGWTSGKFPHSTGLRPLLGPLPQN